LFFDDATTWDDWSYPNPGFHHLIGSTADKICGTNSIYLNLTGSCSLSLHKSSLNIDTSVYTYFQFYAKTISGSMEFSVQFENSTNQLPAVAVTYQYITNYVVENTWTRIRIPLADLGFVGNQQVYRMNINQYQSWANPGAEVYIDELRFVQSATEPLTPPYTGSAAPYNSNTCPVIPTSSTGVGITTTTAAASSSGISASSGNSGLSGSTGSTGIITPGGPDTGADGSQKDLAKASSGSKMTIIIAACAGGAGLLIIAAIIAVIVIRKRRANDTPYVPPTKSESSANLIQEERQSSVSVLPMSSIQGSMMASSFTPPPTSFAIGQFIMARYTGDGKYYRAKIDDIQAGQYLVNYVEFANSCEWLPANAVRP